MIKTNFLNKLLLVVLMVMANLSICNAANINISGNVVIPDTTPPEPPLIISPLPNQTLIESNNVLISGTSEPNSTVIVDLSGNLFYTIASESGSWTYEVVSLTNGTYTLNVRSQDQAGNIGLPTEIIFYLNYIAPTTTTSEVTTSSAPSSQTTFSTTLSSTASTTTTTTQITEKIEKAEPKIQIYFNNILQEDKYNLIPNTNVKFIVEDDNYEKIALSYENLSSNFSKLSNNYINSFNFNKKQGKYKITVYIFLKDNSIEKKDFEFNVLETGVVYDSDGRTFLENVKITCFKLVQNQWQLWDSKDYFQSNPQTTDNDGQYGFLLPNGIYKIEFQKEGYDTKTIDDIGVSNYEIINDMIILNAKNLNVVDKIINNSIQVIKNITNDAKNISKIVSENSTVLKTKDTLNTAVVSTVATSAVLPTLINLSFMNILSQIVAFILNLLGIRKKIDKPWGRILDSTTKDTIPMANISIYDANENKLLESQFSDSEGRFGFLIKPGKYYLKVTKNNFFFPSKIVKSYSGEVLTITQDKVINFDIYIDQNMSSSAKNINLLNKIKTFVDYLRIPILCMGTLLVIAFTINDSSALNYLMLLFYFISWIWELLSRIGKIKSFGIVSDINTKEKLNMAIVRVFDNNSRIVATKVSNDKGMFNFLLPKGIFNINIVKNGYEKFDKQISITKNTTVDDNYSLKKLLY